jgi:hypothetical protein
MAEQQFVQQQPIFTNTLQFAEAQQIGTVFKEYKSRTIVKSVLGITLDVLGGALMLWGLLVAVIVHNLNSIRAGLFLVASGLAILSWGYYLTRTAFRNQRTRIYVGSDGLMCVHKGQVEVACWDQVAGVQRNYIQSRSNYFLSGYTLIRRDGSTLMIGRAYHGFKELGTNIEATLTHYLLPEALNIYNSGRPVYFGVIQVDAQGISVLQKKGPKTLPWSEFDGYKIYDGRLQIKKRDARSAWERVPILQIPNLCVLEALTARIMQGTTP